MLCTLSELKVSVVNPPRTYFLRGKERISLAGSQQIELNGSLSVDFGYACQKISESVLPPIPPQHFCLCECVFISGQFQIFDKGLSIKSKKKFFKNTSTSVATSTPPKRASTGFVLHHAKAPAGSRKINLRFCKNPATFNKHS